MQGDLRNKRRIKNLAVHSKHLAT